MQDASPKLRTVTADPNAHMMKAIQGGMMAATVKTSVLDEITKRIVSGNERLYALTLRARAIADAAFGESGQNDVDRAPAGGSTKLAALDEAASATHRILSELELELERLSQL